MGVHTGDSITVAPAQTLTDKEYQRMRDASIAVLRKIGVDTGGSNVQFAVNPNDGRLLVIEMNPRVSRSSALASKATGFPIAKIAAKLAVGYTLDELRNDITGGARRPPSSRPSTTWSPRSRASPSRSSRTADDRLTTQMKSVGEVMAIGPHLPGVVAEGAARPGDRPRWPSRDPRPAPDRGEHDKLAHELRAPGPDRLLYVADAFRAGWSLERIYELSHIDPWFLAQLEELVRRGGAGARGGARRPSIAERLRELKRKGFSDAAWEARGHAGEGRSATSATS